MIRRWSSLFSAIMQKHAPMREMRVSNKNFPWATSELNSLMISRDPKHKTQISNHDVQL